MKLTFVIGDNVIGKIEEILYKVNSDTHVLFPEHYKHPWDQIRWIEKYIIDGKKYASDISIAIITHSPYIIDHMSTLMLGYANKDNAAKYLITQNPDAFIDPNDVLVYEYKDNSLTDIKYDGHKIDWETFASASDFLNKSYFDVNNCSEDVAP